MPTEQEIRMFLSNLRVDNNDSLKGDFTFDELVAIMAKNGWYQIDESKMPIRIRTAHDAIAVPATYFTHKDKNRRAMEVGNRPSAFIALDHNHSEIWYASARSSLVYFEDYLHYHFATFVQKPSKLPLKELGVKM